VYVFLEDISGVYVLLTRDVSSNCYICVLMLLHVCPHTAIIVARACFLLYVSSYYVCHHITRVGKSSGVCVC
jgi:hypothetical protein